MLDKTYYKGGSIADEGIMSSKVLPTWDARDGTFRYQLRSNRRYHGLFARG